MDKIDPKQDNGSKGLLLKQTRKERGLSLQAVHESTKIPMDVLKAIEEGYTIRTISPFYFRGFVKMYAQFLGVEITKVLEDYHEEQLPKHVSGYVDVKSGERREEKIETLSLGRRQQDILKVIGILVALFFLTRIFGCIQKSMTHRSERRRLQATRSLPRPKPIFKESGARTYQSETESKPVEKKKEPPKASVAVPSKAEAKTASPQKSVSDKVHLKVKALKNGWLQVKVDGNTVFQSTLKQGITESWEGAKTIELSGKNIYNLEYEVNGVKVGSLDRQDRNARRAVVTKDGLSVKE